MRCPGCGSDILGGVGARCIRCGFVPRTVAVTPMETVVHTSVTGTYRLENGRRRIPMAVVGLYAGGLLVWAIPITLFLYFRNDRMPGASLGWRAFGIVLAGLLALLVHILMWAGAFFYGRLVTSDQIAEQAERTTSA